MTAKEDHKMLQMWTLPSRGVWRQTADAVMRTCMHRVASKNKTGRPICLESMLHTLYSSVGKYARWGTT